MPTRNYFTLRPIDQASLVKKMLIGLGIALLVILFFVGGVNEPKPEWPRLWMLRPLIITPLAGAVGGAFYYFIHSRGYQGWRKVLAYIVSLIVYVFILWIGIVLGLDGTLWD